MVPRRFVAPGTTTSRPTALDLDDIPGARPRTLFPQVLTTSQSNMANRPCCYQEALPGLRACILSLHACIEYHQLVHTCR